MGNLPDGTGQLVISGVDLEIIEEYQAMRIIATSGKAKRKRKTWEIFEQIWKEWKAYRAIDPEGLLLKNGRMGRISSVKRSRPHDEDQEAVADR